MGNANYGLVRRLDIQNIADAIRSKTGESGTMTVAQMATNISNISTGYTGCGNICGLVSGVPTIHGNIYYYNNEHMAFPVICGDIHGTVQGNIYGNQLTTYAVIGNVCGMVTGSVNGFICGDVHGIGGNIYGSIWGTVYSDLEAVCGHVNYICGCGASQGMWRDWNGNWYCGTLYGNYMYNEGE